MRIAQVAPLYERVPPARYGGTERVVAWLTDELVRQGHDVTLFASGDSITTAKLVPCADMALWHDDRVKDCLPHHVREVECVLRNASHFDIIHWHVDSVHFPLVRRTKVPQITTLHGALDPYDNVPLLGEYPDVKLVSISDDQRKLAPWATWEATVHHGLPRELHTYRENPEDYLLFLGRVSPEKRLDRAIEIAARAGVRLKIAAKVCPTQREYHEREIAPLLARHSQHVEWLGEVGGKAKDELIGGARALLFPIEWSEPFGLVMIESLACGTPVIAWRRGSVPEVIEHGVTGFVVDDIESAVSAVRHIGDISRAKCRRTFTERFDVRAMTSRYVALFERLLGDRRERPTANIRKGAIHA